VGTSCTTAFDNREQQRLESWQLRAQYRPSATWTSVLRVGQSQDELRSWLFNPGVPEVTEPRYTTTQQQLVWQNDVRVGPGILMTALERRQIEVKATQSYTLQSQDSDSMVLGYQAWLGKHTQPCRRRIPGRPGEQLSRAVTRQQPIGFQAMQPGQPTAQTCIGAVGIGP
jgi:outer membrane cobalamin receptor